jgi:hypothetical protein
MIVEFNSDSVRFATLVEGEPFLWGGDVYLRISTIPSDDGMAYNAVHLLTGMVTCIKDETKVTPVDAKVVVERGNT